MKLKILIIESDESIGAELEQNLKQLGFESCSMALPDSTIDQLQSLNPELAILGPSLDAGACLRCIHKLKILDLLVPVLISCEDLCQPDGSAKAPFNDIYTTKSYAPDEITSTIDTALKQRTETMLLRPRQPSKKNARAFHKFNFK